MKKFSEDLKLCRTRSNCSEDKKTSHFQYLPNLLFVTTIYSLIYRIYRDAHRDTDFMTSVEWIYTILKVII